MKGLEFTKEILFGFLLYGITASFTIHPALAIEVHGHRGARARLPENTLPAFEYAMKLGVDYLEMDMAVTKDGFIVISHDPRISKVICQTGDGKAIDGTESLIHELTLKEVKSYDCGSRKNPNFSTQTPVPGTKIPLLADVFEMVMKSKDSHAKHLKFNIETKIFKDEPSVTVDPDTFVKKFLEVVTRYKMQERVILQSFDFRTLDALRKYNATIPLVALVQDQNLDMVKIAREHHIQIMSPHYPLVTKRLVDELHAMKVQVVPWTPNDEAFWKSLVKMKVDGIISDDPERLMAFLHRP